MTVGHLIVGAIYSAELTFAYLAGVVLCNLTDLILSIRIVRKKATR